MLATVSKSTAAYPPTPILSYSTVDMLSLLPVFLVGLLVYALLRYAPRIYKRLTTPLRRLPGPPRDSLIFGNFRAIVKAENSVLQEKWIAEYGDTIAYPGLFGIWRLLTVDTRAVNHILTHSADYQKAAESRFHLSRVVGPGILVTEEEQHRRQRRVMNPAFGPAQIRELTEIFVEKSIELRDCWASEIAKSGEYARIDVLLWLGRTTLDVIGLAGFNYKFDALNPNGKVNELNEAFTNIFSTAQNMQFLNLLQAFIPPLRLLKTERNRRAARSQEAMRRIGLQLIAEKKAAIMAEKHSEKEGLERKDVQGRDLLTLLIKANMATDIPEGQRLTDEEVLAQVPTFIVAGHETTSTATTWCLFALTQAPDVQRKLRQELLSFPTETPTMDELSALPYLDMVVKETLRFHAPVPMTGRIAMKDDRIPLNKPFTDRYGEVHDSIAIAKGDAVMIPILILNRSKALWGEDALEFKPERWENPPEAIASIPGVWGNLLSFLGGPRSCIGYRFSLVEMKALLFTLVRSFEFELAVPPSDIIKRSTIVQRPLVQTEKEKGNQLPLLVRPYQPA
ncbi:hypothetical protein NM688_g1720 [Phlebia brevispora]|uniref:Uncharacterized protein n=1 Tax=Phlebia brevispora TaxID=194682 RepID=A0ACC1TAA1_9APHY|nr:hypothetical protein NM688_g1720 [Phlebia brevispora]